MSRFVVLMCRYLTWHSYEAHSFVYIQTNKHNKIACWTIKKKEIVSKAYARMGKPIDGRFRHCISRHCSTPQSLSQYHRLLPVMFRLGLHIIWATERGAWRRLLCPVCVSCEYVLGGAGGRCSFFVPRGFLIILGLTGHRPLNLHGGHSDGKEEFSFYHSLCRGEAAKTEYCPKA